MTYLVRLREMIKDFFTRSPFYMTNREILYAMAVAHLGSDASPSDLAPDELGCAESVNEIYEKCFGKPFYEGNKLSTISMEDALSISPLFREVAAPSPGTIIIAATRGTQIGHVGICGRNGIIMSNNSFKDSTGVKGLWLENYTQDSWHRVFAVRKGLKVRLFDLI